jgi:two-component system chemotaxis response regulator CheB
MDGLEATRRIMRSNPTPVVVVSNLVEREIDLSFRALQAGALAVVPKPASRTAPNFPEQRRQLISTLQAMAGVKVVRRWATVYEVTRVDPKEYHTHRMRPPPQLVAIAASAGGPSALATLLGGLGGKIAAPVVIVQHMPDEFIGGLARWLGKFTETPVRMARNNEILKPGVVHLAPGGYHLRVQRRENQFVAQLDETRGEYHYQPAADVLFESVAAICGERGVGIVLTGMGTDGAAGLLAMRRAGARTFAQDENSSVVFGMPSAAIQGGAAERVMSPTQLAASLRKLF